MNAYADGFCGIARAQSRLIPQPAKRRTSRAFSNLLFCQLTFIIYGGEGAKNETFL
jgi:hypothetical protein